MSAVVLQAAVAGTVVGLLSRGAGPPARVRLASPQYESFQFSKNTRIIDQRFWVPGPSRNSKTSAAARPRVASSSMSAAARRAACHRARQLARQKRPSRRRRLGVKSLPHCSQVTVK